MDLTSNDFTNSDKSSTSKESEIEELIAELCLNTTSNPVKSNLRKYQYGKTIEQIEKAISKDRLEILQETANFLKIPNFENKTKKGLSHLIICKIQNLLPDDCSICERRYSIGLEETPILECAICGQGVHKPCWLNLAAIASNNTDIDDAADAEIFKTMYNPLNLPGIFYICKCCESNTIPSEEEGNNKRKKLVRVNSQLPIESSQDNDIRQEETEILNDDVLSLHDQGENEESSDHSTQDRSNDIIKQNNICHFYKNGNCKHGLKGRKCQFLHPKMCRKFTQHGTNKQRGCNKGKKCKDFHPKMCFDSIRKGECFSESCRFFHIKGTKRKPDVIKNTVTHKNNLPNKNVEGAKLLEPDHFLEVVRLLKEEMLDTLNQKIDSMQNQIQQLQQTHQAPHLNPLPTQLPVQTIQLPRSHMQIPQQSNFNPIHQYQ